LGRPFCLLQTRCTPIRTPIVEIGCERWSERDPPSRGNYGSSAVRVAGTRQGWPRKLLANQYIRLACLRRWLSTTSKRGLIPATSVSLG
jgi:hypothetical protein